MSGLRNSTDAIHVLPPSLSPPLSRLETRMTADINVILQLLQRQMAPVPPAYSAVSPSPHPPHPPTLYDTGAPLIHSIPPIPPVQIDSIPSTLPVSSQFAIANNCHWSLIQTY